MGTIKYKYLCAISGLLAGSPGLDSRTFENMITQSLLHNKLFLHLILLVVIIRHTACLFSCRPISVFFFRSLKLLIQNSRQLHIAFVSVLDCVSFHFHSLFLYPLNLY